VSKTRGGNAPWRIPQAGDVANPGVIKALLDEALLARPGNAQLHAKLAYVYLDQYDFASAAFHLEKAAEFGAPVATEKLARSYNMLERSDDAMHVLADVDGPQFERAAALLKLGKEHGAKRELEAILTKNPNDFRACRILCRILRNNGRIGEMVKLCEALASRGASNAQLLFNWGWALALMGETQKAQRLLAEPVRIHQGDIQTPEGFADLSAFNCALAEELLGNKNRLSSFPVSDEANRGSSRVENLFAGARPELIQLVLNLLMSHAEAYRCAARKGFDPWPRMRPSQAHLKAWGLLQRRDAYEEWHIHPGGWLSGVYYVRVPKSVHSSGQGAGCIEYGPPAGLAKVLPDAAPTWRYAPIEGTFLLAPSHYPHRTIPSGMDEDRISIAFDIVPDGSAAEDSSA
jgi:tetratricopeptide (TPR) repeat protein